MTPVCAGTGQDLASLAPLASWELAPGPGGLFATSGAYSFGGGGGGVMVDGAGPRASPHQGQGYGGGGNGYSEFADGLQGVILVEITSEFK